jgi:CRISPR-associated protein (TIGR02710 family)
MNRKIHSKRVLVISVGSTPKPGIASAIEHMPDRIVFFTSQQCNKIAQEILTYLKENDPVFFDSAYLSHTELLTNGEEADFGLSYAKARKAIHKALEWQKQLTGAELKVDITGGTKVMTAALALAAADHPLEFSYVDGDRNPETGRVIDGSEKVRSSMANPLDTLHVRELQRFQSAWNAKRFGEALFSIDMILQRTLQPGTQAFYATLYQVLERFQQWDDFNHHAAFHGLQKLAGDLLTQGGIADHSITWRVWIEQIIERVTELGNVSRSSKPTENLLRDLLANAQRRADEGRYDDALARLYRSVEMYVEIRLGSRPKGVHGLSQIIDAYHKSDPKSTVEFYSDFNGGELGDLIKVRNETILAHGIKPATKKDYEDAVKYLFAKYQFKGAEPWPLFSGSLT